MPPSKKDLLPILTPVVEALRKGLGDDLVAVLLFGSQARGEAHPDSDWDLLIIAHRLPARTLERHFRIKSLLPEMWRARISILAKTPAEFEARLPSLYLDIALDGIVLYDPQHFARHHLTYLRRLISRLGLYRERINGDWIWRWQRGSHEKPLTWEAEL